MRQTPAALRAVLMAGCTCIGFGLFVLGISMPWLVFVALAGVVWKKTRRGVSYGWTHGTARVSALRDLIRGHMLGHDGLILGDTGYLPRPSIWEGLIGLRSREMNAETAVRQFLYALIGRRFISPQTIRISQFTHLATFAPTGRGKGVSVVIPNLLSYRHSCVVTDPKGELFLKTSRHRREKLGHRTVLLDPFELCESGSDMFNPLDFIDDKAKDFIDQCRDFADMLVLATGEERDPHWNNSARMVLTAFIAYVCACEDDKTKRTLDAVRDLICCRSTYTDSLTVMQTVESHYGIVQRQGHSLTWFVEKELGSVLTTVQRNTEFLDSPIIKENSSSSSFDPRSLRTGRVTIYLCLPHDKLETLAPIMRTWLGVIMRTITRGKTSEHNPVVFFLDEAAHLGKIRVLDQAVTLMRGMGIRLWFFFQSLPQVEECFGKKAKTILDNIDTQQYFSLNEYDNAEAISKRIGESTICTTSHSENTSESYELGGSGKSSGNRSTGRSTSYAPLGRPVFRPEELLVLPEDACLIFHRNLPVITGRLLPYFNNPAFKDGGTGNQVGLGRSATLAASAFLLASLFFAGFAFMLSPVVDSELKQFVPGSQRFFGVRRGSGSSTLGGYLIPNDWKDVPDGSE